MRKIFIITMCAAFILLSSGCQGTENDASSAHKNESSNTSANNTAVSDESKESSETPAEKTDETDFSLLFADEKYKNELLSAASLLSEKTGVSTDKENGNSQGDDIDREYETPYNLKYDAAFNLITGHLKYEKIITNEEYDNWCYDVYQTRIKDPTSIDGYNSAWKFAQDFNLKYEDFIDEFERVRPLDEQMGIALTDEEIRLIFEGTEEQILETFTNEFTFYKDGKIYPPIAYISKMSTAELIKTGISPDEIHKKSVAMRRRYPGREWVNWTTAKAELYTTLCKDVKLSIDKSEKLDAQKWIEKNTKDFQYLNNPYVKL